MVLFSLFSLIRRYIVYILPLSIILSSIFYISIKSSSEWKINTDYTVTFSSFSESSVIQSDPMASPQLADFFTNTVEGWIKNNSFSEKVKQILLEENISDIARIDVSKNFRQNFTITSSSYDKNIAISTQDATNKVLNSLVETYNEESQGLLVIIDRGTSMSQAYQNKNILIGIIFISLFFLLFILSALYEILFDKLITKFQVEQILDVKYLGNIKNIVNFIEEKNPIIVLNLTQKNLEKMYKDISHLSNHFKLEIDLFSDEDMKSSGRLTVYKSPNLEEIRIFQQDIKSSINAIVLLNNQLKAQRINIRTIIVVKEGVTKINDIYGITNNKNIIGYMTI